MSLSPRITKNDFEVLGKASDLLLMQLHFDENIPDLGDQIRQSYGVDGNHQYFLEPYLSADPQFAAWIPLIEHKSFIPFPSQILDQQRRIECVSFMGIISEISRGWVSIDNRLYIWNFSQPQDYLLYEELREVIVSVALAPPKAGVFTEQVKYLLVVATATTIVLLALSWDDNVKDLRIQNTKYAIESDNITIFKVVATQSGRIFMAGDDGNLYELVYDNNEDSWTAFLGIEAPYKCRKIKHPTYKLVSLVVPSFVWGLVGAEDCLLDLIVDDTLNLLYTVSSTGNLGVFYLGYLGGETRQIVPSFNSIFNFNILMEAKDFVAIHRGRGIPDITVFQEIHKLRIISIHVIPQTDSKKVHLVAILSSSVRIYLSVQTSNNEPFLPGATSFPSHITVVHVRGPPPAACVEKLKRGERSAAGESFPSNSVPVGSLTTLTNATYSHGVLLLGLGKPDSPDVLLGVSEDLVSRRPDGVESSFSVSGSHPSLREAVCLVSPSTSMFMESKIHDMKEVNTVVNHHMQCHLKSLFINSKTPKDYSKSYEPLTANWSAFELLPTTKGSKNTAALECYPGPPALTSPVLRLQGCGIPRQDLARSVVVLGELSSQHAPANSDSQRRFFCLTSLGLHVIVKIRPVDLLHRMLSMHVAGEEFALYAQTVLHRYGALQFCAMCFGIACGLPNDAGVSTGTTPSNSFLSSADFSAVPELLRRRAMILLLRTCGQPSFRSPYHPIQQQQQQQLGMSGTTAAAPPPPPSTYSSSAVSADSRVVFGAQFVFSAAHGGLTLFFSRLLRPIWMKCMVLPVHPQQPLPTGTGAPVMQGQPQNPILPSILPQRISRSILLINKDEIEYLRTPLHRLLELLRDFFPSSISKDSQTSSFQDSDFRFGTTDAMDGNVLGCLIVRDMAARSTTTRDRDPQLEAKKIEESSLHSLYRLLSRCIQTLSVLEIFLIAELTYGIIIKWEKLHGLTFHALVTSPLAHDTIRSMITDVLTQHTSVTPSSVTDAIMMKLCQQCYHFYSLGDKYTYDAFKLINLACTPQLTVHEKENSVVKASELLCKSSKYWISIHSVSGEESDLSLAVRKLCQCYEVGEVGAVGAVDVILATAANFGGHGRMESPLQLLTYSPSVANGSSHGLPEDSWERGLYHGGSVDSPEDRDRAKLAVYQCLLQEIKRLLSQPNRLGGGVISECSITNEQARVLSEAMVARALSVSSDKALHHEVYAYLLKEDPDWLVSLEYNQLEDFLNEKNPSLLYTYYERHGYHSRACTLAESLARLESADISLPQRIEYLVRAVNSASRASSSAGANAGSSSSSSRDYRYNYNDNASFMSSPDSSAVGMFSVDKLLELQEMLAVAGLQQQILSTLSIELQHAKTTILQLQQQQQQQQQQQHHPDPSSTTSTSSASLVVGGGGEVSEATRRSMQRMEDVVLSLSSQLMSINDLYNKVAAPYKLWDMCLCFLALAREDDATTISSLWKSVIYRCVPVSSRVAEVQSSLRERRRLGAVLEDKRRQRSDILFENSVWTEDLKQLISELGNRISKLTVDCSVVFPLMVLVEELEELSFLLSIAEASRIRGWSARCILQVLDKRVSFPVLLEALDQMLRRWSGRRSERMLQLLWTTTWVVEEWTRLASSSSTSGLIFSSSESGDPVRSLRLALRTGRLRENLEYLHQCVAALSGHGLNSRDRSLLQESKDSVDIAERIITGISLG